MHCIIESFRTVWDGHSGTDKAWPVLPSELYASRSCCPAVESLRSDIFWWWAVEPSTVSLWTCKSSKFTNCASCHCAAPFLSKGRWWKWERLLFCLWEIENIEMIKNRIADFCITISSYFLHPFLFIRNASPVHCSWSLHSSLGWELIEVSVWVPGPPPPCQQSFTLWLIWSYSGSPYKKWVRDVCDWEANVFLEILTFHPALIRSFGLWRSWWATFFESPDNP